MRRKAGLLAGISATLACALAQVQMTPYLEHEPNDSLSAPQVIDTPVNAAKGFVVWDATLLPVGERDFYRFQVAQAGTYSIRVDTNLVRRCVCMTPAARRLPRTTTTATLTCR
jgi:hypothetical protein